MGGAEVAVFHYIRALGMEDYDHYVYCFGADGPVKEKIEALGIPIMMGKRVVSIKQPIKFLIDLLSLVQDLRKFIRNNCIQLIQSHLPQANQLAVVVGKLSGVPAFPTVHSTKPYLHRSKSNIRTLLMRGIDLIIYRITDQILAVSREIETMLVKDLGVKNSKILLIKNGLVFEERMFRPIDYMKEFPFIANKLRLIAVGRIVPSKSFDTLVRAVADIVNQGFNDLLVLIVGDGSERLRLEELIRNLGVEPYVKLLGLRNDVIELMKASDFIVIPSQYEGLSFAMIEAMACGLPIISSDSIGLRDHMRDGKNGLFFPINDYKTLSERILLLANDKELRNRLSQGARSSFEIEYNMCRNVKPLNMVIRKIMRG